MNNSLLIGESQVQLAKLQRIQNAAVTPILKSLHWLPVHLRIRHKLLMITYKVLHGDGPAYLKDLLTSQNDLFAHLETQVDLNTEYGDQSFSRAAPAHWNNLPFDMRSRKTLTALV